VVAEGLAGEALSTYCLITASLCSAKECLLKRRPAADHSARLTTPTHNSSHHHDLPFVHRGLIIFFSSSCVIVLLSLSLFLCVLLG